MKTPVYDGEGWKTSPSCPIWESTLEFSMLLKKAALRRFIKIVVWGNERRIGCVTFLNMLVFKAKLVAQHINKYGAGTCASFEVEDTVFQLLVGQIVTFDTMPIRWNVKRYFTRTTTYWLICFCPSSCTRRCSQRLVDKWQRLERISCDIPRHNPKPIGCPLWIPNPISMPVYVHVSKW